MGSWAEIKRQYATCSDEDVLRLKAAILSFLGIDLAANRIRLSMWPYTQLIEVVFTDGRAPTWVGICNTTSAISQSPDGCECGKCDWKMGLGGTTGPQCPTICVCFGQN